nr:STAS domain-containing protein [Streptosporangium roseum]
MWDFLSGGHLVLDLSPMTFCDSSGLSRIITVFHQCRERGVNLLLAAPPPSLRRILALTGLDRVLQIRRRKVIDARRSPQVPGSRRGTPSRPGSD